MIRSIMLRFFLLAGLVASAFGAAPEDPLVAPAHRFQPDDPAWSDLLAAFARQPDVTAGFEEDRWFPFKKIPVVLKGEVRVSEKYGLSLHYLEPEERIVILDQHGMLVRLASGDRAAPDDPRAQAANTALLHILKFDLQPLADSFEFYGRREGSVWNIALVPRDEKLRSSLGRIAVGGDGATVRRIELRRSALQRVEILIDPPRTPADAFTTDELRRYFR